MMRGLRVFLLVIGLFVAPSRSPAGELEHKVAEAFVSEYAKEQLKFRLAEYLNQHPEIVLSKNPQIGTKALTFVSRMLAVHQIVFAPSDKERGWGALHLVVSPEPATALALVALQIADTMVSLRHQADLAQIQAEIAEINSRTIADYRVVAVHAYNEQVELLSDFQKGLERVGGLENQVKESEVYRVVTAGRSSPADHPFTDQDIQAMIEDLTQLQYELSALEVATTRIKIFLNTEAVGLMPGDVDSMVEVNKKYDSLRTHVQRLSRALHYFFASVNSAALKEMVRRELSEHAMNLRVYKTCVSAFNKAATDRLVRKSKPGFDESELLRDCEVRFKKKAI